jgi:HSP20 family protein
MLLVDYRIEWYIIECKLAQTNSFMGLFITLRDPDPESESEMLFPEAAHLPAITEQSEATEQSWLSEDEGQLSVDVYDGDKEIMVVSAIAGVKSEDLEVFLHNDMLTIRGRRTAPLVEGRPLVRECHWGPFSRSLILPTEIDADKITAGIKEGVLTVRLPKVNRSRTIKIRRN